MKSKMFKATARIAEKAGKRGLTFRCPIPDGKVVKVFVLAEDVPNFVAEVQGKYDGRPNADAVRKFFRDAAGLLDA